MSIVFPGQAHAKIPQLISSLSPGHARHPPADGTAAVWVTGLDRVLTDDGPGIISVPSAHPSVDPRGLTEEDTKSAHGSAEAFCSA